jgi:hypothetical protein
MSGCATTWDADCVEVIQYVEWEQGKPGPPGLAAALPWANFTESFDGQFIRTLAHVPVVNSFLLFLNGVLIQRTEYTVTGAQLAIVPSAYFVVGDQITYVYQY